MTEIASIDRPLAINPDVNRRDAAGEQIKHFIRANRLQPGERLPTVRKMSEKFKVSRDAVWRALRKLQEEGWLELLPNKRYIISKDLYSCLLKTLKVKAIFSGKRYIYFSGFRRLADSLTRECRYHNLALDIQLLPLHIKPEKSIWEGSDMLMVDSDSSGSVLAAFQSFPMPVIGLDANYSDRYEANIVTDHHMGGRIAAEAVLRRNEERATIVYHAGSEDNPRVSARIDGFRQTWLEAGRKMDALSLVPIEWSRSSFEVALNVQSFLKENKPKGCYFVTDGRLATGFLDVLSYMRISVPDEVRLIGYDGTQRGELTDPPMTTIQQDMDRIAHSAIHWVRSISSGKKTSGLLERISPVLIERDSF